MTDPRYESTEEARQTLSSEYDIDETVLDELEERVEEATTSLVEEYNLADELDVDTISDYLLIAYAEKIAEFDENAMWDASEGAEELLRRMDEDPTSSAETVAGRVASRNEAARRLSEAILTSRRGGE